jgi:hypothetical protein
MQLQVHAEAACLMRPRSRMPYSAGVSYNMPYATQTATNRQHVFVPLAYSECAAGVSYNNLY